MKQIIKPSILFLLFLVATHSWGNIAVLASKLEMAGWQAGLTIVGYLGIWAAVIFGVFYLKSILNEARTIPAIGLAELSLLTVWSSITSGGKDGYEGAETVLLLVFPVFLLACILFCLALKPLFERRTSALFLSVFCAVVFSVVLAVFGPSNLFKPSLEPFIPVIYFMFWTPIILSAALARSESRAFYLSYIVCMIVFVIFGIFCALRPSFFTWAVLFATISLLFWAPSLSREKEQKNPVPSE